MTTKEFYFPSSNQKTNIHAVQWIPEGIPKAILQIAHGVTEHIFCYKELAEYFTEKGFLVVGNDHLGHGSSITKEMKPMYFGPEGSWEWVVKDIHTCMQMTKKQYPNIPYILLGLSLGSFAVRTHAICYPKAVDGIILAGTGQRKVIDLFFARFIAKLEAKKAGEDNTTPLIQKLTFEDYNKKFKPNRTKYDWLCKSEKGLDSYMEDPLRGEAMSAGLFCEMINGMLFTGRLKNQKKMDKEIPILLLSGDKDPVGEYGTGVKCACKSFKKAGIKDVSMKIYEELRHNIFLEDEKMSIFEDIYNWSKEKCL